MDGVPLREVISKEFGRVLKSFFMVFSRVPITVRTESLMVANECVTFKMPLI